MTEPHTPPQPSAVRVDESTGPVGPFTPESAAQMTEVLAVIGGQVRDSLAAGIRVAAVKAAESFRDFGRGATQPEPPTPPVDMSPRARALRARQNRHTGPRGDSRRHRRR